MTYYTAAISCKKAASLNTSHLAGLARTLARGVSAACPSSDLPPHAVLRSENTTWMAPAAKEFQASCDKHLVDRTYSRDT